MSKTRISIQKLYNLVQKHLKEKQSAPLKQGRPQTYDDNWILTLYLYQTIYRASYREVLKLAREAGFPTPSLSTYHYRVHQLPKKLFQELLAKIEKDLTP